MNILVFIKSSKGFYVNRVLQLTSAYACTNFRYDLNLDGVNTKKSEIRFQNYYCLLLGTITKVNSLIKLIFTFKKTK